MSFCRRRGGAGGGVGGGVAAAGVTAHSRAPIQTEGPPNLFCSKVCQWAAAAANGHGRVIGAEYQAMDQILDGVPINWHVEEGGGISGRQQLPQKLNRH